MILRPYFPIPMKDAGPIHRQEWDDQHDMRVRGQRLTDYAKRTAPLPLPESVAEYAAA